MYVLAFLAKLNETMGGSASQTRSPIAERLHNSLDMSNSTTTFEKMCEDLMRRMSDSERYQIREEILNSKSDEKSFARIFPFTNMYKMIRTSAETEKSEEKSILFREKGNNSFAQKKYHEALLCYTQAIALAPFESQCLPLAYANRSAVLFAQGNMEGCLEDIRRALTWKYPAHLQYKVYMRKGQCYNILHYDLDKANRNFAKAEELISKSESLTDVQKQELKTKITNYKKSMPATPPVALCSTCHGSTPPAISFDKNAELPSASSCVALTYNPSRGRHLVATRNIQPGDVLVVEKPFSAVLLSTLRFSHCNYCHLRCHALTPCPYCSWAMFCDAKCEEQAWQQFHSVECPAMRSIENLNLRTFVPAQLAIRTVALMGVDNCLSYHNNASRTPVNNNDHEAMRTRGFTSGKLISSEFGAVYHQFGDAQYLYNFLIGRILLASCILKALKLDEHPNAIKIGGLLLKLMRGHAMNAHETYERYMEPGSNTFSDVSVANGLYPTLGLINHSCDQNVVRHYHGQIAVLRAIGYIQKGKEILDTYGPHFLCDTKEDRKQHLRTHFFFDCDCIPCKENWPNQSRLPWRCPSLGIAINDQQISDAYKKINTAVVEYVMDKKFSMADVPNLIKYVKLLDKYDRRLCQEYFLIQQIIKVSFINRGLLYICKDLGAV